MPSSTTKSPRPSTPGSPLTYAATITRSAEMPLVTNVLDPLSA
jgi:hypothetical protein